MAKNANFFPGCPMPPRKVSGGTPRKTVKLRAVSEFKLYIQVSTEFTQGGVCM